MKVTGTFEIANVIGKLESISSDVHSCLTGQSFAVPVLPARDVEVRDIRLHPPKVGLSLKEGQARMMHDLASIELQAMELAFRTLCEFPEAPLEFRHQLADLTLNEASHLRSCLQQIQELGFEWGHWPVHLGLWQATHAQDSLLDRILIVHRYLEGSGLDAGDKLLRRMHGVIRNGVTETLETIQCEEIDHVKFGSDWYRRLCRESRLDPDRDFNARMWQLRVKLPKRIEPINLELRHRAGFTDLELETVQSIREDFLRPLTPGESQERASP